MLLGSRQKCKISLRVIDRFYFLSLPYQTRGHARVCSYGYSYKLPDTKYKECAKTRIAPESTPTTAATHPKSTPALHPTHTKKEKEVEDSATKYGRQSMEGGRRKTGPTAYEKILTPGHSPKLRAQGRTFTTWGPGTLAQAINNREGPGLSNLLLPEISGWKGKSLPLDQFVFLFPERLRGRGLRRGEERSSEEKFELSVSIDNIKTFLVGPPTHTPGPQPFVLHHLHAGQSNKSSAEENPPYAVHLPSAQ
ncbi:hypothetical protein CDAR_619421 [Caerostris darwini]|uniref:Uncharacterized protein n=1 Tax=Caerostris darwini TaxID=1538125 RepID=A0AAV4PUX7_9ARAC|nr:hypothetical protein CDAR_619421 [Caerostris darwini]